MKKTEKKASEMPSRVTVITGDDSIGREKARERIIAGVSAAGGDVERHSFDPSAGSMSDFISRIITPSLFGSMRIFNIRHANRLSDTDLKELSQVTGYDIPDAYIIVEFDETAAGKAGHKKAPSVLVGGGSKSKNKPRIEVMDFVKPPDYRIPEWLVSQVQLLFGRRIKKDDAEYLVECVGTELDSLYSELQKIDIYLFAGAPVDHDIIEELCGSMRLQTAFELARALGDRDLPRALDIVDSLFASSFYAPPCTAAIFRHFWGLLRIRAFARANPDVMKRFVSNSDYKVKNDLAFEIGVGSGLLKPGDKAGKAYPVIIRSRAIEQARSFTDADSTSVLRLLRDFDVNTKTGRVQADKKNMQLLCYRIARAGRYQEQAD